MKISWEEKIHGTQYCSMNVDQEYIDKVVAVMNGRAIDKVKNVSVEDIRDALLNGGGRLENFKFNEYDSWADAVYDYIHKGAWIWGICEDIEYEVDGWKWTDVR